MRWALAGISLCESDFGRFDLAVRHGQEVLAIAREVGDSSLETELLASIGNFHGQLDQAGLARQQLNDALRRARGEGYRYVEIQCLVDLGELLIDEGEFQEAAKLARGALEVNQVLGEVRLAREARASAKCWFVWLVMVG